MKKLNISVSSLYDFDSVVIVNGKEVRTKDPKKRKAEYTVETDGETASVAFFSISPFQSKFYLIYAVLYFIITVFGIFAERKKPSERRFSYRADIELPYDENDVKIEFLPFGDGKRFCAVTSACRINETENEYVLDKDLKKRIRRAKRFKFYAFAMIAVICALLIIL